MEKETALEELNVYVSSPNGSASGSRAKETTFREWVVNNQIGESTQRELATRNAYTRP